MKENFQNLQIDFVKDLDDNNKIEVVLDRIDRVDIEIVDYEIISDQIPVEKRGVNIYQEVIHQDCGDKEEIIEIKVNN